MTIEIVLVKKEPLFGHAPVGQQYVCKLPHAELPPVGSVGECEVTLQACRRLKRDKPDENPLCWEIIEIRECEEEPVTDEQPQVPTIGRIVLFRSRTGRYAVPAVITATQESLNPDGVEAGYVPALSSPYHVHLVCFTPGRSGLRAGAADFKVEGTHGRDEQLGGSYREWDVPLATEPATGAHDEATHPAGTWAWPRIRPWPRTSDPRQQASATISPPSERSKPPASAGE